MSDKLEAKSPVAKRLQQARKKKGLSQKQLGILAGMDPSVASARMNQYERSKHVPEFAVSQKLAGVLEVPVEFLYAVDDELAELINTYSDASPNTRTKIRSLLGLESEG